MKKKFDFSVIMTIYNVEMYLEEAIESVVNQTLSFEENIQLILVNDGSPDNSEIICKKYLEKYPDNVIYIKKENGGVSSARNAGLEVATGNIINFLDSDDYFSKDAFKKVKDYFSEHKNETDIVALNLVNFENSEGSWINGPYFSKTQLIDMSKDFHFMQCQVGASFIKKEVALKYRFDEKIKIHEDSHYLYRIFRDNPRCGVISDETYWHRIRKSGTSATQTIKIKDNILNMSNYLIPSLIDFFKKKESKIPRYLQTFIILEFNYYVLEKIHEIDLTTEERNTLKTNIKNILKILNKEDINDHPFISEQFKVRYIKLKENVDKLYDEKFMKYPQEYKDPKVTIVIPVYNGSNYMREAINSALAQDYKNLEIIVVNDGSTDDGKTHEIALSYGDKIRYFKKENGGVSTALNLAIEKMTGDYFSWLSHDDVYFPNKITYQIKYLKENNLLKENIILYGDYELIDKKSKHISYSIKDSQMLNTKPEYALLRGSINGLTLLIPKKAFKEHGLFDANLRAAQDYELWYRMSKTYKFMHIPGVIVKSRYHAKQVSNTSPRVKTEGNAFWLKMIQDLTTKDMERLELSEYNFYVEMANFIKETPYNEVNNYCKEKMKNIRKNFKIKESKVSVIIPVWNRVNEAIRAIKSVLQQTYKNIEIIVVNDASTINLSKLKQFIKKYKNIKYINLKENSGPARARNIGIEKATGEYIAFLDSDDEFIPEKIEKQLFEMQLHNSIMSHTSYILDKDDDKTIINSGIDSGYINKKLMYSCQIATPTVMFKKEYLIKNNLFFNTTLRIGEDVCFWLTILKTVPLLGIDEPLSIIHSSNSNAAFSDKSQLEGSKNILRFLLNDEYYSKLDIGLYKIAEYYIYFAKKVNNVTLKSSSFLDHPNFFIRNITKAIYYTKNEGLKNTISRINSKIKKKLNNKK